MNTLLLLTLKKAKKTATFVLVLFVVAALFGNVAVNIFAALCAVLYFMGVE